MWRRTSCKRRVLLYSLILVPIVIFITLREKGNSLTDWTKPLPDVSESDQDTMPKPAGSCETKRGCPDDHFSFFIHSGAANVVGPKICVENELVLGTIKNNVGVGINIVILDGRTGDVRETSHFDMYAGEVQPLITFLKEIEDGSLVLIATFDEPATKLTDEARKLMADLGSSSITSLGFRDNWVFVGGKGATEKSNFEKYMKNDKDKNKYENWPEMIDLQGCVPKYLK
ncbi:protein FAM3C-like [Aulostomus maculatus]